MKNKTPVIIVSAVLLTLIVASILAFIVMKKSSYAERRPQGSARKEVVVDFEMQQLADKAKRLLDRDMAEALRQEDVSIEFVSSLRAELREANKALAVGSIDKAQQRYMQVVTAAESRLEDIRLARSSRELKDSTYAKLVDQESFKAAFENTYNEAVNVYNQGLQDFEAGNLEESILNFETANDILDEIKEQSVNQVEARLEAAEKALEDFDAEAARSAYDRVLEIDAANSIAKEGLLRVEAMEAVADEMPAIFSLRESGDNQEALLQINKLIKKNPGNTFLLEEQKEIKAAADEDRRNEFLEEADAAEAAGDLPAAIAALKQANKIRPERETTERIEQLKEAERQARLEALLEEGYGALKAGNFEASKKSYEEALALVPESEEARTGLEKAANLGMANIGYTKSLETAAKYLAEGRIPLATKFYNEAISKRPSTITLKQKDEEARIRDALAAQRKKVSVQIISDGKTYVSLIGVFAPERFKEKTVLLYPDIYTFKGSRTNFRKVESKVEVTNPMKPGGIEIICKDRL